MKLKKCLLTSLSLGLTGITIGAIVSSCASSTSAETKATDPNPASANSISTNPGDPLTPEQQDYQQKLAAEIKVQFDANAKLDYSVPADKEKIDNQIAEYKRTFENGALKDLITEINELDATSKELEIQLSNLLASFYDNFKQKNLIPTEEIITNYYNENPPPSGITNWKQLSGIFSVFYSNPKDIILMDQLLLKNKDNLLSINLSFQTIFESPITLSGFFASTQISMDKNSSSYITEKNYDSFLKILGTQYNDFINSLIMKSGK